jgi:peptide-methionine (S)-S-oxide reductase
MNKIGFGGGCHWCTEAIFQALEGVDHVEQGWIASTSPFDTFSEGVIVHYNEDIDLETLIEVHLLTHSSSSAHSFRYKYRSAVYYFDKADKHVVESIIRQLALKNNIDYITQTLPFADFKLNTESQLDYYKNNKQGPFCKTYIDPKLTVIRKKIGRQFRSDF